ncbi:MAG: hypothetical protein RIE08_07900 [Acidimicrobiales bacterium]
MGLLDPLRGHGIRDRIRWFAHAATPSVVLDELTHRRSQRERRENRSDGAWDLSWIEVTPNCRIAVFWSVVPGVGSGPSASVYVHDSEVMRLDCFGADEGHMHLNPTQVEALRPVSDPRVYFEPGDRGRHVQRARFELATNLPAALAANRLRRVRSADIPVEAVTTAAATMATSMAILVDRHGSGVE